MKQFPSLQSIFITGVDGGKTRALLTNALWQTVRFPKQISVIVSEEMSERNIVETLLDINQDSLMKIDNERIVFAKLENVLDVVKSLMHHEQVHLYVDAVSVTKLAWTEDSSDRSKKVRFTVGDLNDAALLVNGLSVAVSLDQL